MVAADRLQSVQDLIVRRSGPQRLPGCFEQDLGHPERDERVVVEASGEVPEKSVVLVPMEVHLYRARIDTELLVVGDCEFERSRDKNLFGAQLQFYISFRSLDKD